MIFFTLVLAASLVNTGAQLSKALSNYDEGSSAWAVVLGLSQIIALAVLVAKAGA